MQLILSFSVSHAHFLSRSFIWSLILSLPPSHFLVRMLARSLPLTCFISLSLFLISLSLSDLPLQHLCLVHVMLMQVLIYTCCVVVYCRVSQCVQCVAVCCSVLQCVAAFGFGTSSIYDVLPCIVACCGVLQSVAACSSVLQRVDIDSHLYSVCCSVWFSM